MTGGEGCAQLDDFNWFIPAKDRVGDLPAPESQVDVDAPNAVASGKETAGGSSKVGSDICMVPDVLQTAVSVMTVVTEKWMERFVLDLDDLRSVVLVSREDPAGGSSDVGSDVCVVPVHATDSGIREDSSCREVDGMVRLRPGRVSVCF